MILFILFALNP